MRPYFYLGDRRALTRLSTNELFYVYTEDRSITPWILVGGHWEVFVDDLLCALVRPGDVFVDVGANMGYYTVKMGVRVGPRGRVHSFEPNPLMHGFVYDNVEINGLSGRTTLHQAAAGAAAGEAWFSFKAREPGGGVVHAERRGAQNEFRVPVVSLDEAVPHDQSVDLIKIDAEGFEPQVLEGMTGLLARSPEAAVVVELSYREWMRFGDPLNILHEAAGRRDIYRIHHSGRIQVLPRDDPHSALEDGFVSYLLLLPPSRRAEVQIFLHDSDETFAPPSAQRPAPPSLAQRFVRRLKSLTGPA